jgi:beta-N-acetylhexosaminidase
MVKSKQKKGQKKVRSIYNIINSKNTFVILLITVIILSSVSLAHAKGWLIPGQPEVKIVDGVIKLDSLSLKQKIAQMVIVQGDVTSMLAWKNMQIGGIHLFARSNDNVFRNTILDFQYNLKVPLFVSVDLEGCVSPFKAYRKFSSAAEVFEVGRAFEKGVEEGEFLKDLGININFAPVVDLDDQIWKCRSFPGDQVEIAKKAQAYILGLQSNGIIATIKHYPGKTLVVRDPHKFLVNAKIDSEDVLPYQYLFDKGDVKAMMISHLITDGEIDTNGRPSVVTKEVVDGVKKNFDGLIITDEIHMLGLRKFFDNIDQLYVAVFKAGNDIILNFDANPNEVNRMINVVRGAVFKGEIPVKQIDASVTKILEAKGFIVK